MPLHLPKILKGHRYISNRVYAMTLQLWHPVFLRCFDKFQQNLQAIPCENELCPCPIGTHGLKNKKWEILKFIRKSKFVLFHLKYRKHVVGLSSTLINICTFYCVHFLKEKKQFLEQEKNFEKSALFVKNKVFNFFIHGCE